MSAKTEILELIDKLKTAVEAWPEDVACTETCSEPEAPAAPEAAPAETPPAAS